MKRGNVMFWKYLFLGFIVCFPVQAQENANGVSERNNYELFIICVAIYLLFKAVGVIWHYRCPNAKMVGNAAGKERTVEYGCYDRIQKRRNKRQ